MAKWTIRDVDKLFQLCKEKKAENLNQVIIHEGTPSDKVIVILEGEVEIVRTNLSKIYFNAESGVLGIAEDNHEGKMIRS